MVVGFIRARASVGTFIRVCRVYSSAPSVFIRVRWRVLRMVGFPWVHSGAPLSSSGSFLFVVFIRTRFEPSRVHSGHSVAPWRSSCSFVFIGSILTLLGVVAFIRVR